MPHDRHILAYDVRDPRRLRRVHRYMLGWGVAIQYSVFLVAVSEEDVARMMAGLAERVEEGEDDVRLYRVPERGGDWIGREAVSDAFVIAGEGAPCDIGPRKRRS